MTSSTPPSTASSTASSLGHLPPNASNSWAFDESVTQVFDDMLARSIPQYDLMRRLVVAVGARFVQPHTAIVDLGTSRGEMLAPFIERFCCPDSATPGARAYGVEISEPMLAAARARFASYPAEVVRIDPWDLRWGYPQLGIPSQASLTLCVLTLMFVPINYRQRILREAYRATKPGGAIILVEKVLGDSSEIDALEVALYHELKERNGYSHEEVTRKQLALEGVQVPITAAWNEDLLRQAGFHAVDCIWRYLNFGAWVAIRD